MKDSDPTLTSDHWNAVTNFNLTPYAETVETLRTDLLSLKEAAERTTYLGELRHVETTLDNLENKIANIRRFAPSASQKRGLLNAGGLLLKSLFGTATSTDVDKLHTTITDLQRTHLHLPEGY
jgi:hypothetical protein